MVFPRTCMRVSKYCGMIAQVDRFLVSCSFLDEKHCTAKNPSFVSHKIRGSVRPGLTYTPMIHCSGSTRSHSSLIGLRVTRTARNEAQEALFDYLHSTRSYSFSDAEHISKNSPNFLQMLLSKIDSEKYVKRSLAKFLRYNPINEFEPFLESLGLSPSEYSSLLPQHLMFLSDDHLLLENFNVLCNYGIPRGRMGKMYKEAREIFSYDYGLLSLKLQDYENLGLSKSTVIKLAGCCPTLLVGGVDRAFVKVMEKLSGLGLEKEWIGGYLSDDDSYNWRRLLDTMDFLEKVGYSTEQLNNFFQTSPELVFEGSGKMVYSLFGRLHKLGLKMNEIHSLIIQNPQILSAKCTKNLFRAVGFLFDIGMGAEDTRGMVATNMELLCSCSLKGPKTVCRELKISKESLCEIIREDPEKLFSLASKSRVKSSEIASHLLTKQAEKTAFLVKLGYVENSEEMMIAQKKFRGRGDQLQERFDCLVQAGLDCHVVSSIIKHAPMVLNQSKDVIETKIDWLTNCLGYPLQSVVAFPAYLCYDLARIKKRFKLYVWLRDRGAAKPMLSLSTILACSDARFEKYFVDNYPEGRTMWENIRNVTSADQH